MRAVEMSEGRAAILPGSLRSVPQKARHSGRDDIKCGGVGMKASATLKNKEYGDGVRTHGGERKAAVTRREQPHP